MEKLGWSQIHPWYENALKQCLEKVILWSIYVQQMQAIWIGLVLNLTIQMTTGASKVLLAWAVLMLIIIL